MQSETELGLGLAQMSRQLVQALDEQDPDRVCRLVAERQRLIERMQSCAQPVIPPQDLAEAMNVDDKVIEFLRQSISEVQVALDGCRRWGQVLTGYSGDQPAPARFVDRRG